ncbi:hypothetical protein DAPPUDRAFT_120839, partial [Daphnia pulex]
MRKRKSSASSPISASISPPKIEKSTGRPKEKLKYDGESKNREQYQTLPCKLIMCLGLSSQMKSCDTALKNVRRAVETTNIDTDMEAVNQCRGERQKNSPQQNDPSTPVGPPQESSDSDDENEASMLLKRSLLPCLLILLFIRHWVGLQPQRNTLHSLYQTLTVAGFLCVVLP